MKTLLFIHGMFLTAKSWNPWIPFFTARGYACFAPDWPLHEGEPDDLRAHIPEGTGKLSLDDLVAHYAVLARTVSDDEKPVVIGHSLGGLIAQKLVAYDLASAAVCISSVAPNAMLSFDWGFFRNSARVANPLRGDSPCELTPDSFHAHFANTLPRPVSDAAYRCYVVHESRRVLRDALGHSGHIDLDPPHAPLLFIAGSEDKIIPDKLNYANAQAYADPRSITDFKEFAGRGHFICGEPAWEEIATYVANWVADLPPSSEGTRTAVALRW